MTRYYLMLAGALLMGVLSAEAHIAYWASQFGTYPPANGGAAYIRIVSLVSATITAVALCILEFFLTRFFGKPKIVGGLYFWLALGAMADFYWASFHLMPMLFPDFSMGDQMLLWRIISIAGVAVMQLSSLRVRDEATAQRPGA